MHDTYLFPVSLSLSYEFPHDAPRAKRPHVRRAALPQHFERHRHVALQGALVHLRHRRLEVVELGTAAGRQCRRRSRSRGRRIAAGRGFLRGCRGRRCRGRRHGVPRHERQRGGVQTLGRRRRRLPPRRGCAVTADDDGCGTGSDPRQSPQHVEGLRSGVVFRRLRRRALSVELPRPHLQTDPECRDGGRGRGVGGDGEKSCWLLSGTKSDGKTPSLGVRLAPMFHYLYAF